MLFEQGIHEQRIRRSNLVLLLRPRNININPLRQIVEADVLGLEYVSAKQQHIPTPSRLHVLALMRESLYTAVGRDTAQ